MADELNDDLQPDLPLEDAAPPGDTVPGDEPAPVTEPTPTEPPEVLRLRQETDQLRRELDEQRLRQRLEAAAPPVRTTGDPDYEREEEQLKQLRASGADAERIAWAEWQVNQARTNRAALKNSVEAKNFSADAADRADFARLEAKNPRRFKHYAPRVEAALAEMRQRGQPPIPRMALYRYFLGEDVDNGVYKSGTKSSPASASAAPSPGATPRVDRGRMPGARSDVNPKDRSGMTEHQKRIERMKAAHAQGKYL